LGEADVCRQYYASTTSFPKYGPPWVWCGGHGLHRILNDPVQLAELLAFEQTRLPSGVFRYAASVGGHDDTVIALCLAYHEASDLKTAAGQSVGIWKR